MEIFSTIFRMEMARKITGTDIFIYGQYTYTQQRIMDENRSKRTCRSTYEKKYNIRTCSLTQSPF